jgi:repressor LexA
MPTINKTLRIFEFIKRYSSRNGFAPTFKEIGQVFEMESSATVHAHLKKMEARNWIRRSRRWRGIEIVEQEKTKAA